MTFIADITDSFGWDHRSIVKKICAPLFQHTKLCYFDFARLYKSGHLLVLFTDGEYVNYFLNHDSYKTTPPPIYHPGRHLWQSYIDNTFVGEAQHHFNYSHGITVVKEQSKHTDIFNFAAKAIDKQVLSIYLNQFDIIEQFISHFLKNAQPLINGIHEKDLINLQGNKMDETRIEIPKNDKPLLLQQNNFHLQIDGNFISLSKRESQCLAFLLQGQTAKEIAKKLNVSFRTIETYCDQLRQKTNSKTRLELLGKIENRLAIKELLV